MTNRCWPSLALSLLLLASAASAQETGRIDGVVVTEAGKDLGGVAVILVETGAVLLTDGTGKFAFSRLTPGTYSISFTMGDNSTTESGIEVRAGATTTIEVTVPWDVSYAETITVYGASRRTERIVDAPAAVTVVSQSDLALEAPSGQLPEVIEFAPGVDYTQSGLYDINFNTRGFNSSLNRRILTLIDGRDPSVPFLGSTEWAAISYPMDEFGSVELVRGPGSALYGANAFNGVLNMVTHQPRDNSGGGVRFTGGDLSMERADARWADGIGDSVFYRILGGWFSSDDFTQSRNVTVEYPGLPREAVPLALDDVEVGFGGLRIDSYFPHGGALTFEGGTAMLEGPTFMTGIGRVQTTDVDRPWARVNYNLPHWNFHGYHDQRIADAQEALASGADLYEDSSNTHFEVQGNYDFAGGKGRVVGGASYHMQNIDTANPAGVQTLMFEAQEADQEAVFGQGEYRFGDRVKAVVAARWDDSDLHDSRISPKGAVVFSMTPDHTLRVGYNEAFQVPNYSEFFLRVPVAPPVTALAALERALAPILGGVPLGFSSIPVLALGNEDLEVEEIQSIDAGYAGIIGGKFYVTLDVYRTEIENFVTDLLPLVNPNYGRYVPPAALSPQAQAIVLASLQRALPPANYAIMSNGPNGEPIFAARSYTNAGKVDTQGVEVGLNYYLGHHWLLEGSYSWFDFEVKEKQLGDQVFPNAPENKASAGITYRGDRFNGGLHYRWVEAFFWSAGVFNGPVPSYDLFDLNFSVTLGEHVTLGLDVSNLLDDEHYEAFGGDILERRALGYAGFRF